MTAIKDIKKFLLRAVLAADGQPIPDAALDTAAKDTMVPRPLQSLIDQAKRELSDAGFLHGTPDELDGSVNWTLTMKGKATAEKL
jgi:hypothetical protein